MPIYEYLCSKCGVIEAMQRITEKPLSQCPSCRRKVTKLISRGGFQLKGSGWYLTDYARKDGGDSAGDKKVKDRKTESVGSDDKTAAASTGTEADKNKKGKKSGEKEAAA